MNNIEYVSSLLICIAEEESLCWLYRNEIDNNFIDFSDLKKILYYFLNNSIMELNSYNNGRYEEIENLIEILEDKNNWLDSSQRYTTNLTEKGFCYFNIQKYKQELEDKIFPDFKIINER